MISPQGLVVAVQKHASATLLTDVWGLAEATAILQDHRVPVLAIAEALVERRTLNDPAEIDRIIATGLAREGLAAEHARRDAMRATAERAVANASLFEPMVQD